MEWKKVATILVPGGGEITISVWRGGILLHVSEGGDRWEGNAGVTLSKPVAAEVGAALVNAAAE